jgi:hypothetical protein
MGAIVSADVHRRLAVDLFNFVWTLLEKPERTREDEDTMIHAAHASRYHWGEAGTAVNLARGEWQVSRVYATLARAEPALHHARRCLELCQEHEAELDDFDLPYAYEALARAHAVARNGEEARRYARLAREAGERIAEADDREHFLEDLASLP